MDEFSIGIGVDGNPKTVGFYVGKKSDPLCTCIPADHLIIIKDSHKLIAQVNNYLILNFYINILDFVI